MSFCRRDFIKTAGIALGSATLPSWVYDAQASTAAFFEVNKHALAAAALTSAKRLGASYADIRINRYRMEAVSTRERQIQNVSSGQNFGFGVRVLVNGTWGFSASPLVTEEEVQRVTTRSSRDRQGEFTLSKAEDHTRTDAQGRNIVEELVRKGSIRRPG